ncbi:hypothetical protein [Tunturiibacter lichenicola]|uniref:hypothetical protein n=1 Tax=Tunturiibacter lichenicola TaxID=2051959 RepID=UPI0021B4C2C9|nr:hypothetical protein [Edaphobacter lichenicola]
MHGTREIGTHFVNGTNIATVGDDGFGGVLTHLELRTVGLLFVFWFLVPDGGVLVARENLAAFRRFAIGVLICTSCGFAAICFPTCALTLA